LNNRIKNFEGWSTSSEETPEYFGAKGALSFKNENIMCDITQCLEKSRQKMPKNQNQSTILKAKPYISNQY
jgi:hypothetical protein